MGYSHYDAAVRGRAAWNAGKTVGTKTPVDAETDMGNPLLP